MIVTRRRPRRRNLRPLVLALAVLALVAGTLAAPPVHAALANSPLRPAVVLADTAAAAAVRPFTFAAQQRTIAERNREIRALNDQLEDERKAKAGDEARVEQLQQQVAAAAELPAEPPRPTPRPSAAAFSNVAGPAPSDGDKRLAATWAAMDPERAAAVVQRLPDGQVTRVLAAMDADSAGAIMDALPPAVAARISRAQAQFAQPPGR